jgi:hypothetical protein
MAERRNIWMWASAALLCTMIVASYMAINYQAQTLKLTASYEALLKDVESLTIKVNLKIDYGKENVVWFNNTRVPLNANLLTATQVLTDVEYKTSDFGAFITKINGVGGDANTFWLWYYYDINSHSWKSGETGSNAWVLHNGDIVAWSYTTF